MCQMLESKWVSSSKDILTFRKALNNVVTSLQFRKFVSIKGDNLENDVLFWQEVQRYKVSYRIVYSQASENASLIFKYIPLLNKPYYCMYHVGPVPPALRPGPNAAEDDGYHQLFHRLAHPTQSTGGHHTGDG